MFNAKKIPIGLYEKALPGSYTLRQKLQIAKTSGYDFMEISIDETDEKLSRLNWKKSERNELLDAIREIELPILSMCLSGHRKYPLGSKISDTRKKSLEIMEKAIIFALETGIRTIQLAGYDVYYEDSDKETIELFIEGLKLSVDMAHKAGIILAIEIMDSEFINSIKKAMHYVKMIDSPYLQVYPDIGNMSAWGNDLKEDFASGKGHISAIHVKETRKGIYRDLSFGEGTVDFIQAFSILNELNYKGPFVIEMWANSTKDSIEEVKNSLLWVKDKMSKGGLTIC
jgi:predicted hexulose-6-phosphate isomerase